MEENVPGAYAQKPLKAVERIIAACSREGDLVVDFFSHSGTTLIACERLGARVLYIRHGSDIRRNYNQKIRAFS